MQRHVFVSATLVVLTLQLAAVARGAQGGVGRAPQADDLASRLAAR